MGRVLIGVDESELAWICLILFEAKSRYFNPFIPPVLHPLSLPLGIPFPSSSILAARPLRPHFFRNSNYSIIQRGAPLFHGKP